MKIAVVGVGECCNVWVFECFAFHLLEVALLSGSGKAKCAVEFVIVVGGFCKYVVL